MATIGGHYPQIQGKDKTRGAASCIAVGRCGMLALGERDILAAMTTAEDEAWPVKVIRSAKRSKTVSAELRGGVLLVRAPATISDGELNPIIARLQARLRRKTRRPPGGDADLERIAERLNTTYFAGRLHWRSIRYVDNQAKRFGSCTPSRGTIRISRRLATMPAWVLEYVVMHELAHLEEANHGAAFWRLVNEYPLTERARGYLMAAGLEEDGAA
jgi:predicted metal-dependent hydrolase